MEEWQQREQGKGFVSPPGRMWGKLVQENRGSADGER